VKTSSLGIMAQTTYSTLKVNFDDYEEAPSANLKKVTSVATVLSVVVVMFFAGRVYEGQTTPFTHEEVLDIASKCGTGEFIGGCVECKTCAVYEFANGGCSFFKDAFCSYCEPIANCQRENIQCETREDQICLLCDCNDFVKNWTDVELGRYLEYEMFDRDEFAGISTEAATYSCYWNDDCRPCTVCDIGYYEVTRCTQSTDTECQKCADCQEDEWVSAKCIYDKDTECTSCTHCQGALIDNTYTQTKCYRFESTGPLFDGADAICDDCQECAWDGADSPIAEGNEWTSSDCTEWSNSECTVCSFCAADRDEFSIGGEYIDAFCQSGDTATYGADTVCADCTDDVEGYYESDICDPLGTTDAVWTQCTTCLQAQWEHTACALSTDTICPPCYPINHCKPQDTMCSSGISEDENDSVCIGSATDAANPPAFACQKDFYGETCSYWRTYADCGVGPGYRERTVKTGKFRGETNGEFIAWCMMLCDEFPDCMAFEIYDMGDTWDEAGSADAERDPTIKQSLTKPNSMCSLKHIATGSVTAFATFDLTKDCFSNIRRQREDDLRTLLSATDAPLAELDLVFAGVGSLPIVEGDWKVAATGGEMDMLQRNADGVVESQLTRAAAKEAELEAAEERR